MSRPGVCKRFLLPLILVLVTPPAVSAAEAVREIAKKALPSVVLLVMEDDAGRPVGMGSGFTVREGVIATNLHVIEGASRGYAKLPGDKARYDIGGTLAADSKRDIVLLSVEKIKAPVLAIGDSKKVAVGDEVYAVGNPRGLEGTFSSGIVSGIRTVGEDYLLQITAPISPGSSGGPVLNGAGEVIGVSVATFKGGQNLNFAIPSSYLSALGLRATKVAPLSSKERSDPKKQKSLLDDFGARSTEGVTGSDFLWEWGWGGIVMGGRYTFTLRNNLRDAVRDVICVVVFRNDRGEVLEADVITCRQTVLPGMGKRLKSRVDYSVQDLTSVTTGEGATLPRKPVEFRVIYFDLVEPGQETTRKEVGALPLPADSGDRSSRGTPVQPPTSTLEAEARLRAAEEELAKIVAKIAPAGDGPEVIESRIDGEFQGWDGNTIFKLENGQIWEQAAYAYTYHYAFRPKVLIFKTQGVYKMKVDGASGTVFVRRLK